MKHQHRTITKLHHQLDLHELSPPEIILLGKAKSMASLGSGEPVLAAGRISLALP